MFNSSLFSSSTDNWSTPQWFFNALDQEFRFTLDPCADDNNHKCSKYYTILDNGLSKSWENEVVFCNPPYGRSISHWVAKCYNEVFYNNCICAVMLIPSRTDTLWFHRYVLPFCEIRFVQGRLKFGDSLTPAPFPSLVAIFRKPIDSER